MVLLPLSSTLYRSQLIVLPKVRTMRHSNSNFRKNLSIVFRKRIQVKQQVILITHNVKYIFPVTVYIRLLKKKKVTTSSLECIEIIFTSLARRSRVLPSRIFISKRASFALALISPIELERPRVYFADCGGRTSSRCAD